jgi:hypothetical protein
MLRDRFRRINGNQNIGETQMSDDVNYREFEEALTDVLAETEYSLKRRSRLAKARGSVDKTDPRYFEAVDRAFSVLK